MRGSQQNGAAYRLVVHLAGGTTQTTAALRSQKHAIANVATTVRQATHRGRPVAVVLQRHARSRMDTPDDWEPVERWGPEVLARIVGQGGHPAPAGQTPHATPAIEPVPGPPAPAHHRRTHRWHVALVLTAAAVTWLVAVLFFTGGRLFAPRAAVSAPVATTLPLEAPATRSAPARASTLDLPTGTVTRPAAGVRRPESDNIKHDPAGSRPALRYGE